MLCGKAHLFHKREIRKTANKLHYVMSASNIVYLVLVAFAKNEVVCYWIDDGKV